MIRKLLSRRGESLVEMLVSIAIMGLSIALMITMVMTSSKMTESTRKRDSELLEKINVAEKQDGAGTDGTIKIKCTDGGSGEIEVDVLLYSADDSTLISYTAK